MDLMMPIMNGYDAAIKIMDKLSKEKQSTTYLIACSGNDDETERNRCLEIGFSAFVPKPI